MALSTGCNHVALVTGDLDRFIDFYSRVFEADVLVDLREGPLRHALVDLGGGFCLHPFEFADGNPNAAASPAGFSRGHLDHVAIDVADPAAFEELRTRLVDSGASDGTVTDFGLVRTVSFRDPDGMDGEIAMSVTGVPRTFDDRIQEPYVAPMATPA